MNVRWSAPKTAQRSKNCLIGPSLCLLDSSSRGLLRTLVHRYNFPLDQAREIDVERVTPPTVSGEQDTLAKYTIRLSKGIAMSVCDTPGLATSPDLQRRPIRPHQPQHSTHVGQQRHRRRAPKPPGKQALHFTARYMKTHESPVVSTQSHPPLCTNALTSFPKHLAPGARSPC